MTPSNQNTDSKTKPAKASWLKYAVWGGFALAALLTAYLTFVAVRDLVASWEMTSLPGVTIQDATPTPGGGSAAAFSGALASALISMVARLTVGRAKYAEVDGRMNTIASRAEVLRSWFQDAVKKDEEAFENLMLARKQPRNTDEEIAFREKAIADAIEGAAYVPLQVVEKSVEVMRLAREVAEFGNLNAITDAGSAASLAWSALKAASLNVKINASSALDEMKAAEWIRAVDEYDMDAEIQFSGLKNALKSRANITY